MAEITVKKLGKRAVSMIIAAVILLIVVLGATPLTFFASINNEWKTRKSINSISMSIDAIGSKSELVQIAQNDRILDIIAVDKDGAVIYTVKNMGLFSDASATVLYDSEIGLIKFNGIRKSYFERNSVLGALLNVGDDDILDDYFDDDDDDKGKIPTFDYRFVKDNTYQAIELLGNDGSRVYIVCTQDLHAGFIFFLVISIALWSIFALYFIVVVAFVIYRLILSYCPECAHIAKRGNKHCTKCGHSFMARRCESCNEVAGKNDIICGKCGKKLDDTNKEEA